MKIAITVDVKNNDEAALIERGLADPETKAVVMVMGTLADLSADERLKVMDQINESLKAERKARR